MTRREVPLSCARARLFVEAYLDGDVSPVRAARLERHWNACVDCQAELAAARRVLHGLRTLPMLHFPEAATAAVFAQTAAAAPPAARGWVARLAARLGELLRFEQPLVWRPALAVLSVVATAAIIALLAREPAPGMRAAELARAEREARWALAYVSKLTSRAGGVAMQEIMVGVTAGARNRGVRDAIGGVVGDAGDRAIQEVVGGVVGGVITERVLRPVTDAVTKPMKEDQAP